ncbi:hypothetical protein [Nitrosomonas sp.]|nr:hypothetical protein [Nitrosomonas sp.]
MNTALFHFVLLQTHEKYLFLSAAKPYRSHPKPEHLILPAERIEE